MEKGFEDKLRKMNEAVKTSGADDSEVRIRELEIIAETAELKQTSKETQADVLEIQRQKAQVMKKLREYLAALDDPEKEIEYAPAGRTVGFDEISGSLYVFGKGGAEETITFGELMTGGEWGQKFKPNESVPRQVIKEFLVRETHRQLLSLADRQITLTEKESWYTKGTGKEKAYGEILASSKKEISELSPGILAERMVYTLMSRLSFDADLPFEIRRLDAYADVEEKIDFIVHIKSDAQGVRVAREGEVEERGDVGVQFTTRSDEAGLANKEKQIGRAMRETEQVKRIVLVSVPLGKVRQVVDEWLELSKSKKVVGGPDKLLDLRTQEKIFRAVLNGLFNEKDIDMMWQKALSAKEG